MLRAGLVTVLLMGLGSTAMASDRVRVFVTYDSGGYYNVGHHYYDRDCRDGRHWARRDRWSDHGYYRSPPDTPGTTITTVDSPRITGGATSQLFAGA